MSAYAGDNDIGGGVAMCLWYRWGGVARPGLYAVTYWVGGGGRNLECVRDAVVDDFGNLVGVVS
jgi:hypothetical protein